MRIGCLFFSRFAVQVELRDNKKLPGKPVIIGGLPYEPKAVHDASKEAIRHGVKRGMPLRQAYALCPKGIFLPLAEDKYNDAFMHIISLLSRYSPVVETRAEDHAFLDVTLEHDETRFIGEIEELIGRESSFQASAGIASNKFVARMASQVSKPGEPLIIPGGEEKGFLNNLAVDFLPASSESLRRLRLFGIYTLGELAKLPREAVKLQFGGEGQMLWEFANGIDNSRLMPCEVPQIMEGELAFEPPAENLDLILHRADALLSRLSWQLKQRWQCCRRLTVSLSFTDDDTARRVFHFKEPTSSTDVMLHHLKCCLDKTGFAAPVNTMRLSLADFCPEEGRQASFPDRIVKNRGSLKLAISQLQGRYGKEVVRRVLPRYESILPEDSFSFTEFDSGKR